MKLRALAILTASLLTTLAPGSLDPDEALDVLRRTWSDVASAQVVVATAYAMPGLNAGQTIHCGIRVATCDDGRLAYVVREQVHTTEGEVVPNVNNTNCFRYVDVEGDVGYISRPPGSLYEELSPIPQPYAPGGLEPSEALYAPWPRIVSWLDEGATNATISREGSTWVWTSPALRLRLEFEDDGWVTAVESCTADDPARGVTVRHEFVRGGSPFVASVREVVIQGSGHDAKELTDVRYAVQHAELSTSRPDAWFRFDAGGSGSSLYDRRSGNVYAPDGEVLYNYDKLDRQLASQTGGWLPGPTIAWQVGVIVVVLVTGVRVYQRHAHAR